MTFTTWCKCMILFQSFMILKEEITNQKQAWGKTLLWPFTGFCIWFSYLWLDCHLFLTPRWKVQKDPLQSANETRNVYWITEPLRMKWFKYNFAETKYTTLSVQFSLMKPVWISKHQQLLIPWQRIYQLLLSCSHEKKISNHYNDVIMSAMVAPITSLTIVYSTVNSGADQRKHQSSVSLAFARGIHRWPMNSPHKGPVTRKILPFDDVIMTPL